MKTYKNQLIWVSWEIDIFHINCNCRIYGDVKSRQLTSILRFALPISNRVCKKIIIMRSCSVSIGAGVYQKPWPETHVCVLSRASVIYTGLEPHVPTQSRGNYTSYTLLSLKIVCIKAWNRVFCCCWRTVRLKVRWKKKKNLRRRKRDWRARIWWGRAGKRQIDQFCLQLHTQYYIIQVDVGR